MDEYMEIRERIRELVHLVKKNIPENFDDNVSLFLYPFSFLGIHMVYLYMMVLENDPEVEISAEDLKMKKFDSIANITQMLFDKMNKH